VPTAEECARLLVETVPSAMRLMGGVMRRRAGEDEPISIGHVRMLKLLHDQQRTLGELAACHHVSPSTMSRTVEHLVRRDWIDRRVDPEDRRQVLLRLTEDGRGVYRTMMEQAHHNLAELIAQLDEAETEQLFQGLSVLQRMIAHTNGGAASEQQPS
jgi:DNA-binding MarR family transcriptional regulator